MTDVPDLVGCSSLAELAWRDPDGAVTVRGVLPLVRGSRPVLAFTYAAARTARSVATAETVVLSFTETRSTGRGFAPTVVRGRPRLVEDPSGDVFTAELLAQELRRYPPSRLFADSPLLQREHWWYLPRLLVEIDVDSAEPGRPRSLPGQHLLVVDEGPRLALRVASPVGTPASTPGGELVLAVDGAPSAAGPAVLFGQDASFPDLEQWSQWWYRGHWDGAARFQVSEAPASTGLPPPPGVLQRWRRQRELERRCRSAIPV